MIYKIFNNGLSNFLKIIISWEKPENVTFVCWKWTPVRGRCPRWVPPWELEGQQLCGLFLAHPGRNNMTRPDRGICLSPSVVHWTWTLGQAFESQRWKGETSCPQTTSCPQASWQEEEVRRSQMAGQGGFPGEGLLKIRFCTKCKGTVWSLEMHGKEGLCQRTPEKVRSLLALEEQVGIGWSEGSRGDIPVTQWPGDNDNRTHCNWREWF